MKLNSIKSLVLLFTAVFVTGCINDDDYGIPNLECVEPNITANKTVADMYELATSSIQQYPVSPNSADFLEAYVVSSDAGGNFFKTLSLQTIPDGDEPPLGFSIPIDVTSLFVTYEPGRKVYVRLNGMYYNILHGSLIMGDLYINPSTGATSVGRISPFTYGNKVIRGCEVKDEEELVSYLTIEEAKNDGRINTLIELTDVQFADEALGTTYYDPTNTIGGATNHNLVDADGNSIIFRTSSFALYAGDDVAEGRGSVRGVLTKFNDDYQFVARTGSDIKLTEPRLVPVFSENFEGVTNTGATAFINLPGWTNVSMNGGTARWTARIFSNNKFAQMSAFGTNDNNVDARLITPAINISSTEEYMLRFGYKTGFANGIALSVWYSTDYDGSGTITAVNAATWIQLNMDLSLQTQNYPNDFVVTSADLSGIEGPVYISFRYQGAANGVTTTYQVDDIQIYGN